MSNPTHEIRKEIEIPFPAWTIVDEEKHAKVGLPTSTATMKMPNHLVHDFLSLFSSREIASTFIDKSGGLLVGHVPLKFESIGEIRDLLVNGRAAGVEHVGIDLSYDNQGIGGQWFAISIVIDRLNEIIASLN